MNYQRIYNQIIERAKIRKLACYKERHHIIPKCLGGLDDKENLVELTAREHFICHRLLVLIHPNESKLKYALWMMNTKSGNQQRYEITSRVYEKLKSEYVSFLKGKKNPKAGNRTIRTDEQREHQSRVMKGREVSKETRQKLREVNTGRVRTQETCKKLSEALKGHIPWSKGKHMSEETKQKLREINTGKKLSDEIIRSRGTQVEIECKVCKKTFIITRSRVSTCKYCSKECMAIDYRNNKPSEETKKKMSISQKARFA